jgi:serine/threonine protein kinase
MAKPVLEPGSVLDGFTVGSLIHRGGMAHLWEVTRPGETLPMLMKIPVLHEGEDPAAIVGFEMEQMIMPRLKGVHVPRFIANGDFAVQPYIVMERIAGTTLQSRTAGKLLPVDEAAQLGATVATALNSLHEQNVIHLDVKPANIMLRESGEAVLIDYGLARHRDLPDLMSEEFRLPYGTAPFMAPEQVLGVRSDPRSDIFALGVMLYVLVTGKTPFGESERLKGLKQRLWRDPHPPRALEPSIPPWFQEIVLRCLEVHAARRHQTAAQLAFDLRHRDEVALTDRAERLARDSFFAVLRRKSQPEASLIDRPLPPSHDAPIVAAAIDLSDTSEELARALRQTLTRILERTPAARLACINVLKLARISLDRSLDAEGHNRHVQCLVELKEWARPLGLDSGRVSFHVLEAVDPAEAILDYVRANNVDHIVMGARANSPLRKLLGSVSGKVAAEAPCTVTVVRHRESGAVQTDGSTKS